MADPNVPFPNIEIQSIYIGNLELFPRNQSFQDETVMFDQFVIEEDMFAESIFGSIVFYDPLMEVFTDKVKIGDLVVLNADGYSFEFEIIDINIVTDLATKQIVGPNNRPTKIIIRFASKLFSYSNFDITLLNDFIGKISLKKQINEEATPVVEKEFVDGIELKELDDVELDGFVQVLARAAIPDKDLISDETFNSVWFKYDPAHYPWSKIGSSPKLSQLMNYVCEYACFKDNPNAVNFFFWEDLFSWNFRCIESLVQEPVVPASPNEGAFLSSIDENIQNAIASMEVINTISPTKLLSQGAFDSEYIRIKPNWSNIYSDYMDTNYSLEKTLLRYDYGIEKDLWRKIDEGNRIFVPSISKEQATVSDIPGGKSTCNRITDTNFGYYSSPYNFSDTPWWNYYEDINGYGGDLTPDEILRQIDAKPTRLESKFWQSQFDFCELPASHLLKIYKEIKWPTFLYKRDYARLKRIKKQWEVYKKSICCEREMPETFFAVLTGAKKIHGSDGEIPPHDTEDIIKSDPGGVWAYEWCEVEFWPRQSAKEILKDPAYEIIEFEDNTFPFVFVKPPGYLRGLEPPTSDFPETRAFNLNEILNSRIPRKLDKNYEFSEEGGVTSSPPFTLIMNPGITDALGFTGSVEEKSSYSSYPNNFAMMPVGKFRIFKDTCPPTWYDAGNLDDYITQDFYFGGRIVQMYRISKHMLKGIVPGITLTVTPDLPVPSEDDTNIGDGETDLGEPVIEEEQEEENDGTNQEAINQRKSLGVIENLFVFDVENAHDGLCQDC